MDLTDFVKRVHKGNMEVFFMSDKEALAKLAAGATLDSATSERLWRAGYVEVQDVSDHDDPHKRQFMATRMTYAGKRFLAS